MPGWVYDSGAGQRKMARAICKACGRWEHWRAQRGASGSWIAGAAASESWPRSQRACRHKLRASAHSRAYFNQALAVAEREEGSSDLSYTVCAVCEKLLHPGDINR